MQNDLFDLFADLAVQFTRRPGIAGQPGIENVVARISLKRARARHDFIQNDPDAIDIRSAIRPVAADLFRRHVFRSSDLRGEAAQFPFPPLRDAEVDDVRTAVVGNYDVAGLQVTVDSVPAVNVLQDFAQAASQSKGFAYGKLAIRAPFQNVVERRPRKILHRDVRTAFLSDRDDLENSRMAQLSGDHGFPRKSRGASEVCLEFRPGSFDRNDLTRMTIEGLEDRRHSCAIDKAGNFETVVENLSDLDFLTQMPATLRDKPLRSR